MSIDKSVLLELAWVLGSVYELDREAVHRALELISRLESAVIEDATVVCAALERYANGAELADTVHVES